MLYDFYLYIFHNLYYLYFQLIHLNTDSQLVEKIAEAVDEKFKHSVLNLKKEIWAEILPLLATQNQEPAGGSSGRRQQVALALEHHRKMVSEHFPNVPFQICDLKRVEKLCAMDVALNDDNLAVSVVIS